MLLRSKNTTQTEGTLETVFWIWEAHLSWCLIFSIVGLIFNYQMFVGRLTALFCLCVCVLCEKLAGQFWVCVCEAVQKCAIRFVFGAFWNTISLFFQRPRFSFLCTKAKSCVSNGEMRRSELSTETPSEKLRHTWYSLSYPVCNTVCRIRCFCFWCCKKRERKREQLDKTHSLVNCLLFVSDLCSVGP